MPSPAAGSPNESSHPTALRGIVLTGVLLLLATGCTTSTLTSASHPVAVTVLPASATLRVGAVMQLTAGVQNAVDATVSWSSSAPGIAAVSSAGLVTAIAPGGAVIRASVGRASGHAAITVRADSAGPPGGPVVGITISAVSQNGTGARSDPSATHGLVDVAINLDSDAGQVGLVRLAVDSTEVCSREVGSSGSTATTASIPPSPLALQRRPTRGHIRVASVQSLICTFNTAAYDSMTGAVAFLNGPHTLVATAVGPRGSAIAVARSGYVFQNPDDVVLRIAASESFIGSDGTVWDDGDVTVVAVPLLYSGGTVTRASFSFESKRHSDGAAITLTAADTTAADGFSFIWLENRSISERGTSGLKSDSTLVRVATFRSTGDAGPSGTSAPFPYDNAPGRP